MVYNRSECFRDEWTKSRRVGKSIFLEKGEIKNNFIKRIEESLERKASNLQKNKTYEMLNWNDIKELAVTIDINSFDDIINNLDAKLEEIEEKKDQKKKKFFSHL